MSVALLEDAKAELAYWDTTAAQPHAELFSIPGITGWEEGIEACIRQLTPVLGDVLASGGKVLDLGCGPGRLTFPLAYHFPKATMIGVDISPRMVAEARREAKARDLRNARFVLGNGRTLPKTLPRLDGAFSVLTFQHLPHEAQRGYLRAVAAKLKPGGVFRLQFVTSKVDHFLSHGVEPTMMIQWCRDAGLRPGVVDTGVDESWGWITVKRPA